MLTICGSGDQNRRGFKQGQCLTEAELRTPYSVCANPLHPGSYFIGDSTSIRSVDSSAGTKGVVSLFAGSIQNGRRDGVGEEAEFASVCDLLVTSAGDRLYVCDSLNCQIRMVDTKSRRVKTLAGSGPGANRDGIGERSSISNPRRLAFDRNPSVKPESYLFITTDRAIRRLHVSSGEVTTCKWLDKPAHLTPLGVCSISVGLIVSCFGTHSIYLFDPYRGTSQLLAGAGVVDLGATAAGYEDGTGKTARFWHPYSLVADDGERCIYITDHSNQRIRRMTLPDSFFQ